MAKDPRVVGHDRYDDLTWQATLRDCSALRELRIQGLRRQPCFGGLLADLFAGLYKLAPRLLPEAETPPEATWQRQAVCRSWEAEAWAQTREGSVLDELLSALGTLAAGEAALKELERGQPEASPAQAGQGDGADVAPGSGGDEAAAVPPPDAARVRALARSAAGAARAEVAAAQEALAAWGLDPAELRHLPLDRRIEIARTLSGNAALRHLAEAVGGMRALAAGVHRRRLTARPGVAVGVETGDDPQRLLPQELALLGHPAGRAEGMRHLATRSALVWKTERRQPAGRGPLVVLCDASGSTRRKVGATELTVEGLIRAMALGLGEIAARQRRPWAGVVFSGPGSLVTFEAPKGRPDPEGLLGFATATYGGGTDWEGPLREALRLCRLSPYRHADVVLITDGLCALPAGFAAELAEHRAATGTRILGVLVGEGGAASLAAFCDRIIVTTDLRAAAEAVLASLAEDRPAAR